MAAKVNKTVVLALIGGVICVVAALMVMINVVLKSSADLAAQGDKLMAAGKYDEAAAKYSKAVNKEQNNVGYIEKWADSLSKQSPASLQAYSDRYRQWLGAQRLKANVLRVDPAAHKVVLDLQVRDARLSNRSGPVWQSLESDAADIINRMSREPQDKIDQIRRYRGIATVGKLGQALEVPDEDRKRAKEDLVAALTLNQSDPLAAFYYADLMRMNAEKARRTGREDEADQTLAEGLAVMQNICEKNPTSTPARLGLLQLEQAIMTAQFLRNPTAADDFQAQMKPKIEALLATLESEDPKTVDEFMAALVLDYVTRAQVHDAVARGVKVFEKIHQARPDEPFPRLMAARFHATTDSPRAAADAFKKIMDLPNLPVSPIGLALFNVRDSAAIQRVDALIAMIEKAAPGSDDRAKALAEAKQARDELRQRATVDDAPKTLIDAKLALLSGDSADARRLLDQYNRATANADAAALLLTAQVLESQGLKGEAKIKLMQIIDKKLANVLVYIRLTKIEADLGNNTAALNWCETGLRLAPNEPTLLKMQEALRPIVLGVENASPLYRALNEARNALQLSPPDFETAKAKALTALPLCVTPADFAQAAQLLRRVSRTDGLDAVNRGLEKFPGDKDLAFMQKRFMVEDPVDEIVKQIDADAKMTPIDKAAQKFLVFGQAGKADEANKALDEAAKLDPDHAVVVAGLFERALADVRKDPANLARARELAQKAKEKNLDKVEGRIYEARLLQADNQFAKAIPLLERATEIDGLNPLTWRYLGTACMAVGDKSKALRAYERSLQIKPDDITSINTRIQCLMAMDRLPEALAAAKEASRLGVSNPLFVQMWLLLEFRVGDKDLAISRRAFIQRTDPKNLENSMELAKCLMEVRRLEDAQRVMDEIEKSPVDPEVRKNLELPLGMLKAALRGSRGENDAALADFEKLASTLPEDRREAAYMEFANVVSTLAQTNKLAIAVLEAGRKYQDKPAKDAAAQAPAAGRIDRMLGDMHFGAGEWDKAREAYSRARDVIREDEGKLLLKRIIECHMKAQQFAEARRLLDAEGGDKSGDLQILLLAAQLEFSRGERSKALELLDRSQQVAPSSPLPYRQRGVIKMEDLRTLDDAIVDFELAVGLEPRNIDLVMLLARSYLRKGEPARAQSTLQKAMSIQPESSALRNEYIQHLMSQNKTAEALGAIDDAVKLDPTNTRWYLLKGVILQRQDKQREAAAEFEKAWKINPSPEMGKALVDALIAAHDKTTPKDRGLLDAARSVIDAPEFAVDAQPMCKLSRVSLYLRQGRRADAVNDLRAVVNHAAANLDEQSHCIFILDELRRSFAGDMKQVNAILDEVTPAKGWPDMFTLHLARARLGDASMRPRAMSDLEKLIQSQDRRAALGAASTLGATEYTEANQAEKRGDKKAAEDHFDRAVKALQAGLTLDPDMSDVNNNLAFVIAKGKNQPASALSYAIKATAKDPNNPNFLDTLGAIHLMLGDLAKAEEALTRALSTSTDGVTRTMPTIHMIEVKLKKKDLQAAEDLYKQLLNLQESEPRVKQTYQLDIEEIGKRMKQTP